MKRYLIFFESSKGGTFFCGFSSTLQGAKKHIEYLKNRDTYGKGSLVVKELVETRDVWKQEL